MKKKRLFRTLTATVLCLSMLCMNASAMQIFVKTLTGKPSPWRWSPATPFPP